MSWSCQVCTFLNHPLLTACELRESEKPAKATASAAFGHYPLIYLLPTTISTTYYYTYYPLIYYYPLLYLLPTTIPTQYYPVLPTTTHY